MGASFVEAEDTAVEDAFEASTMVPESAVVTVLDCCSDEGGDEDANRRD